MMADAARIDAHTIQIIRKCGELVWIGLFVHAVEQRHAALTRKARNALVGREHEILDHLFGIAPLTLDDFHGLARLIEHECGLLRLKLDAAARLATLAQFGRQRAHRQKRIAQRAELARLLLAAGKKRIDIVIHQPRLGACEGSGQAFAHHASAFIDLHQRAEGEFIFIRPERADAV